MCIADVYIRSDESYAGCTNEAHSASQATPKITRECKLNPCAAMI